MFILKKITSLLLLLCVIFSVGLPAFASEDVSAEDAGASLSASDADFDPQIRNLDETGGEEVQEEEKSCLVKVTELVSVEDGEHDMGGEPMLSRLQTVWVEVISGPRRGETHIATFDLSDVLGTGKRGEPAKVGSRMVAYFSEDEYGDVSGIITGYVRQTPLIWLALIFFAMLIFITGKRGLKSVVALVITCIGLVLIMVPLILSGFSPIWAAILGCVFSIATTLVLVYGFTRKTLAAALGAIGGVVFSGIMTAVMNSVMHMTGMCCDESRTLALTLGAGNYDMQGIMFASIVIGALGGTIDVGISIASALDEMREHAPHITAAEMMSSGLNIGSDIMGASLNTLIMAYIGGSIHLLMLLWVNGVAFIDIINEEIIVNELMRALAGSFGLLFTVPITAIVAAAMMCKGGFGKLTWDMIPSVKAFKETYGKVQKQWKESIGKARERFGKEEEEYFPSDDNLYKRAERHFDDGFMNSDDDYADENSDADNDDDDRNPQIPIISRRRVNYSSSGEGGGRKKDGGEDDFDEEESFASTANRGSTRK